MNDFKRNIITLLSVLLFANFCLSQPIDNSRSVVIESIWLNNEKLPENTLDVLASEGDSITINFKLKANDGADKTAFLFQTVFKNGVDSSTKTLGVTSAIFKNLKNDKYILRISAFDLQRKWSAIPVEVKIQIDNEKYRLARERDSLNLRIKTLIDLVKSPDLQDSTASVSMAGLPSTAAYIMIGLIIVLIIIVVYLLTRKTGNKDKVGTNLQTPLQDLTMNKSMVNKSDYEALQIENSRLRAEIASLRGQIEAMSIRSTQLSVQNKELQHKITKLTNLKSELEELQKQKDELFAVIIHDIKNPAALIKSLVELLTSYDLSAIEQQEIIADIATTTIRIVALSQEVSRILTLESNKSNLNFEPCDLNIIAQDVIHRNQIGAKSKALNLFSELAENLPVAEIDPQRIDEVLDNLISNAIKFTPKGGTVRIKTYVESNSVVCEINDNGLGLTEDDLKHAFQRGARLSAKPTQGESSTGLGLWIVKKLLDAHHGKVWVKSTTGKGSTFSFSLPFKQPEIEE
jgi:signal transduction histidine kinase